MSAFSTSSLLGNTTVTVPTCDVWGHILPGTANTGQSTTLVDGSGVQSVERVNAGAYGISFSASNRLGAGGYVILHTPEVSNPSTLCVLACPRQMNTAGVTGAASTQGTRIQTWGFQTPAVAGGYTAQQQDFTYGQVYINFACFHLSNDTTLRQPSAGTYALVPGAAGYGLSGSTYNSQFTNLLSKRTATAYGTVVLSPVRSNFSLPSIYSENSFNVRGVSATSQSLTVDVVFNTPMSNSNYCVLLCSEVEPVGGNPDYASVSEYTILAVDRTFKTSNGFRIQRYTQNPSDNSWTRSVSQYQGGRYERIHFMVFGGGTYGQP
jgi:hypothetical protein